MCVDEYEHLELMVWEVALNDNKIMGKLNEMEPSLFIPSLINESFIALFVASTRNILTPSLSRDICASAAIIIASLTVIGSPRDIFIHTEKILKLVFDGMVNNYFFCHSCYIP